MLASDDYNARISYEEFSWNCLDWWMDPVDVYEGVFISEDPAAHILLANALGKGSGVNLGDLVI